MNASKSMSMSMIRHFASLLLSAAIVIGGTVPTCDAQVIGGGILGGSGGVGSDTYPLRFSGLQSWHSSDYGTYYDAAVQFTATDKSYLTIADNATLSMGSGVSFTITGWFLTDNAAASTQTIIAKGADNASITTNEYAVYLANGTSKPTFAVADGTSSFSAAWTGTISASTWYFFVAKCNTTAGTISINVNEGTPITTSSVTYAQNSTYAVNIGNNSTIAPRYMGGRLDSLMIFKSVLDDAATTILYNSGVGRLGEDITDAQKTAWGAVSCWDLNGSPWVDSWGANDLTFAASPIIRPPVYGTELLTNGGFETAGEGDADIWNTWAETASDGALANETTDKYAGDDAAKVTAGATKDTNIVMTKASLTAAMTYRLEFWNHGDGTNSPRYYVKVTGGADILATAATNVTGTNYTKTVYDVVTPTGCTSIDIGLVCPNAVGGIAYFDSVSLKAVTTAAVNNGGFEIWSAVSAAQLVANPYFTSDAANWTGSGAALSSDAGGVSGNMLTITNSGDAAGEARSDAITTVANASYKLTAYHKNGSSTGKINIGTAAGGSQLYAGTALDNADWTASTVYFKATTTTTYITLVNVGTTTGNTTLFDSVECIAVPYNADTWTESVTGSSLIYREDTAPYSGSHALAIKVDGSDNPAGLYQSLGAAGKLYSLAVTSKGATGTPSYQITDTSGILLTQAIDTTYTARTHTFRPTSPYVLLRSVSTSATVYLDSITLAAAEILAAPGIARGAAQDSNFAAQLNGTSQNFSYTGTAFNPGTGDFSLGCAFYLDTISTVADKYLFSMGSYADNQDVVLVYVQQATRKIGFLINDGTGGFVNYNSTETVSVGNWYSLIINADRDGNVSYALNSSSLTSLGSIAAKNGNINPGSLYISRYSVSSSNFFPGRIDNVFYANRLLTADEIAWLHNDGEWRQWAEFGVAGTDGSALTASVVKGMWEFETAASLGTDSTGNGNTLTMSGSPTRGYGINYLAGMLSHWADRSGNGYNALSTALATRMGYCSNSLNGYPVICGDGVDDVGITTLAGLPSATIFVVGKINAASDIMVGVQHDATTGRSYVGSNAADQFSGGVAGVNWDTIKSNDDPGTMFYGCLTYSGDTNTLYLHRNGVLEYSAAQSGAVTTTRPYYIGAFNYVGTAINFLDGEIADVLIWNRALSDGERKRLEQHFSLKYGISP